MVETEAQGDEADFPSVTSALQPVQQCWVAMRTLSGTRSQEFSFPYTVGGGVGG